MRCPYCPADDTQVKDSRPIQENSVIRRRRTCSNCGGRFTTFERVQLRELMVIKKDARHVPFEREKLQRSFEIALRKRPIDEGRIDQIVSAIVRQLESGYDVAVTSQTIGSLVLEALKRVDHVAFVRYASVYRDFADLGEFSHLIGELSEEEKNSDD
jgi:transcriptional repressor NrdR